MLKATKNQNTVGIYENLCPKFNLTGEEGIINIQKGLEHAKLSPGIYGNLPINE
jgi:hypothetical protein